MMNTPSEIKARKGLEGLRWERGVQCPMCKSRVPIYKETRNGVGGYYRCPGLGSRAAAGVNGTTLHRPLVFTVRTGTVLERSHVSLLKWLYFFDYYIRREGEATPGEISEYLKVTRRTAQHMVARMETIASEPGGNESPNLFLKKFIRSRIEVLKPQLVKAHRR